MFGRLFGRSEKQAKPREMSSGTKNNSTIQSLERLEATIELLEKRESLLEKKISDELAKAKDFHAKKNTRMALQCMKRKKMYEEQLLSIFEEKNNLDTLHITLQNQSINKEVFDAQMHVKEELMMNNKKMNADLIETSMEELLEEIDKSKQVCDALRQPIGDQLVDEDELLAELSAEMEEPNFSAPAGYDRVDEAFLDMPSLPSAALPSSKPQLDDDEALRALEAELQS
uniref:Uncharacterized protein n=1 Tax=Trypanosoma vivax (strain Y486) TaxID=1055687 RepID=G0UCI3_TRYVY|nr:conserved hypothetical protein [Trypanosoma vivax Y486]